jgi:hypothetical protein
MVTLHSWSGWIVAPEHVSIWIWKSPALSPLIPVGNTWRGLPPSLTTTTDCGADVLPDAVKGKTSWFGVTRELGGAWGGGPDRSV